MQQLNLFEPRPAAAVAPIWTTLDEKRQAAVVTKLAELMAKTVAPADEETHDE
jgi:hypothetical protein